MERQCGKRTRQEFVICCVPLTDNGFLRAAAALPVFVHHCPGIERYQERMENLRKLSKGKANRINSRFDSLFSSQSRNSQRSLPYHVCPFPKPRENTCFSPSLCSAKTTRTEKAQGPFRIQQNSTPASVTAFTAYNCSCHPATIPGTAWLQRLHF